MSRPFGGPRASGLPDQVVTLGDVGGAAGGFGERGGGGVEVAAELVQVTADGVPTVPLADDLTQCQGPSESPSGWSLNVALAQIP